MKKVQTKPQVKYKEPWSHRHDERVFEITKRFVLDLKRVISTKRPINKGGAHQNHFHVMLTGADRSYIYG